MEEAYGEEVRPVWGLRVVVPGWNVLVHLVSPIYSVYSMMEPPTSFSGKYATCGGVLDGNLHDKYPGEWKKGVLPNDTVITCVVCFCEEMRVYGRNRTRY